MSTPLPSPNTNLPASSPVSGWWVACCLFGSVVILFGPTLFSDRSLLFRDAAHFYAPLWEWARFEWGQGRVPLWNPLQNLGVAHLAENTSSVFYPGKLLFAVPGPFPRLFNLFLAAHVGLAGITMYRLLRGWGRSTTASGIAAISYALSGGVLFQYCNPPFLIGAAWLPAAVGAAGIFLKQRSLGNALRVASVLALMTLGGDAQTVYHVGLMMVLLTLMLWRESRRAPVVPLGPGISHPRRGVFHGLAWIGIAAILGIGLAAVQILPTAQHTAESSRATYQAPRSLDEVILNATQGKRFTSHALLDKSPSGADPHHQRAFQFSVGPWRWAELIWPNVSGRWFPIHARWIDTLAVEGRVWTPSLYLGILPFWLAIGAIRYRRQLSTEGRWVVWCTLLSVLGSMGAYGIGWLIVDWTIYQDGVATNSPVGRNFGNLYWLMTVVLPWYVKFRYPAKLWTIATFGFSVLAGLEWDRRQAVGEPKTRWLAFIGILSLFGLAATLLLRTPLQDTWNRIGFTDAIFGPLDVNAAWRDLVWAFSQTALLCLATTLLLSCHRVRTPEWIGFGFILIITADLLVTHHWMLPSAPSSELGVPPAVSTVAVDAPTRIYRAPPTTMRPDNWRKTSSPDRMAALVRRDRRTLYPQHHLSTGQAILDASTTIPNRDWHALMEIGHEMGERNPNSLQEISTPVLAALNVEHRLTKPCDSSETTVEVAPPHGDTMLRIASDVQRVWAVDNVITMPWLAAPTREQLMQRTREVWFPEDRIRDFATTAVIESLTLPQRSEADPQPLRAECRVIQYAPDEVVVAASVSKPALLVLCDQFHPDWQVKISVDGEPMQDAPLLKTNRVMRGVWLKKAGDYEVCYTFRSRAFDTGAAISASMWAVALLGWMVTGVNRWRRTMQKVTNRHR